MNDVKGVCVITTGGGAALPGLVYFYNPLPFVSGAGVTPHQNTQGV